MSVAAQPQWIAKMYPPKTGRDHLGLGSVSSDQILPTLSPGINVLTVHPRYHSLYTFLLDEFWRRDRPRSRAAWVRFYRPREFIFSVGAHLCDKPEHGDMGEVVGGQKTGPLANQQQAKYDATYDYIKSELGGYGLYYASVMAELGLIYPGGRGLPYPIDVPSERGKEVADAFREAVGSTTYYREYFSDDTAQVPIGAIKEYMRRACLCQLQVPDAPDRPLLLEAFLHGGVDPDARRATFRLFLDIAEQTQGHPVDENALRQLLYFQATDGGMTYNPTDSVEETYRRWRLYQAREYYAFALNAMWYHLCDWGLAMGGDVRPVPLSHVWEHVDAALDFGSLATRLAVPEPGLAPDSDVRALLDWLTGLTGAAGGGFDLACTIDAPIHEHRLYRLAMDHRDSPEVMVAGMITMLALIALRFDQPDLRREPEWEISRMGLDGRLSVDGFLRALRGRLDRGPLTIQQVADWLYRDYIILQHQLVATRKLPENTFRFHREGDRLRFYNLDNGIGFMNSRFNAISTTIHELGLCADLGQTDHPLTSEGEQLLHEQGEE